MSAVCDKGNTHHPMIFTCPHYNHVTYNHVPCPQSLREIGIRRGTTSSTPGTLRSFRTWVLDILTTFGRYFSAQCCVHARFIECCSAGLLYLEGNDRLTLRSRLQWEKTVSAEENAGKYEERAHGKVSGELQVTQAQQADGALNQLSQIGLNNRSADEYDATGTREAHDPRDSKTLTEDLMRQLEKLGHHRGALMLSTSPGMPESCSLVPAFQPFQSYSVRLSAVTSARVEGCESMHPHVRTDVFDW